VLKSSVELDDTSAAFGGLGTRIPPGRPLAGQPNVQLHRARSTFQRAPTSAAKAFNHICGTESPLVEQMNQFETLAAEIGNIGG
jgi:hypothetical protein